MLRDQSGRPRPRRESEQTFDEASANEGAGAKAFATAFVADRFNGGDQSGYFRRFENRTDVSNRRATRYLASCHASCLSCGHGLRRVQPRGGHLFVFAGQTLTMASDDAALEGAY
jgi:hypothetical protein